MTAPTSNNDGWRRFWPLLPLAASTLLALSSIPPQIDDRLLAPSLAKSSSQTSGTHSCNETLPHASAHARESSLAWLPDGRLAAVWVGAKSTDLEETTLWFSVHAPQGWTTPLPVANRESTAGGTFARTGTLGTPSLQVDGSWLEVWYSASVFADQGKEGTLHQTVSTNLGKTWSKPSQLIDSSVKGKATRRLAPPLSLAEGGLIFPLANTQGPAQARLLFRSATGRSVTLRTLPVDWPNQYSALIAENPHTLLALAIDQKQQWYAARSEDAGEHWENAALSAPNDLIAAPMAAIRLQDGRLLLAGNQTGQHTLALWVSDSQGKHWTAWKILATAPDGGASFSFPSLLQSRDGRIHLVYSRRGEEIEYQCLPAPTLSEKGVT